MEQPQLPMLREILRISIKLRKIGKRQMLHSKPGLIRKRTLKLKSSKQRVNWMLKLKNTTHGLRTSIHNGKKMKLLLSRNVGTKQMKNMESPKTTANHQAMLKKLKMPSKLL